ncbi:MAG: methyltransferase [Fusobacterium sp.]|uniref:tRNA1(Val) (adenine(37)-N6)-methyltransferase n=1 Tax=Fusobacterium sp. TaxID=68766 RepID=UPI0026DD9244|nr:methyltransferase [Fusobacterium sp.]MDO4690224.1 methyltransferase [Fusobacterium sp.]
MIKEDEIIEELNDKYTIIQKKVGYKYGIDTLLLAKLFISNNKEKNNLRIVDIGTGNGILPVLLYEQKNVSEIVGVDIQEENIERAKRVLKINNILNKIELINMDIKKYPKSNYFDIIISNPPYMEIDGKKINENEHKKISRHELELNLSDFISSAKRLLKPIGKICFIHRTHRLVEIIKILDNNKFNPSKIIFIYSANNKSSIMYIEALKGKEKKLEIENYFMLKELDYK